MVEDSADRDETTPEASVGSGVASPSEGELRSGATGAEAETPALEAGSDEQTVASEQGSAAGVSPSRGRRILVLVLIWGTTVLGVLGIFAVWANRQLLNPDNWSNTSAQLLENNDVKTGLSNYIADQLHANVNGSRLKAILPPLLQPLAAPLAAAAQNFAVTATQRALNDQSVQTAWKDANRVADQALVNIVNGGRGNVQINGHGEVTLNLAALVTDITNRIGLPNLATKLPPNVAQLKIMKSTDLGYVQTGGRALKSLALLLTIIVPLLYAFAIYLARGRRRRTLMNVGLAITVAGVLVLAARAILQPAIVNSLVKVDANKPAGNAVVSIATAMLTEIAGAFVFVGIPLILAGWFAGPASWAVRARRAIAPFLRDQPVLTFVIVTVVMALLFVWGPIPAFHRLAGIIVFLALALFGTEVLRRQTAAEFPDARGAPATAATRAGTPA
ncbi:MAG TPA: hypothetical protein VEF89_30185 [Solirubrobacteraceae bacterium]|nr:hypothetical protein [Solirubrobacteraceae bacterium]